VGFVEMMEESLYMVMIFSKMVYNDQDLRKKVVVGVIKNVSDLKIYVNDK
jgi:hypothetical protein